MTYLRESTWDSFGPSLLELAEENGVVLHRQPNGEYLGVCPFHQDKTPSFFIRPETDQFYCFGCGVGGGIREFLALLGQEPPCDQEAQRLKRRWQQRGQRKEESLSTVRISLLARRIRTLGKFEVVEYYLQQADMLRANGNQAGLDFALELLDALSHVE
mgnify:FL=1